MRTDGWATFYVVQHLGRNDWCDTDLSHVLFSPMSYAESTGPLGRRYRKVLEPQSACSALWQRFGIHGFVEHKDATKALRAAVAADPQTRFRLVQRQIAQHTEVVS